MHLAQAPLVILQRRRHTRSFSLSMCWASCPPTFLSSGLLEANSRKQISRKRSLASTCTHHTDQTRARLHFSWACDTPLNSVGFSSFKKASVEKVNEFLERCHYFRGEYNSAQAFAQLTQILHEKETALVPDAQVCFNT